MVFDKPPYNNRVVPQYFLCISQSRSHHGSYSRGVGTIYIGIFITWKNLNINLNVNSSNFLFSYTTSYLFVIGHHNLWNLNIVVFLQVPTNIDEQLSLLGMVRSHFSQVSCVINCTFNFISFI